MTAKMKVYLDKYYAAGLSFFPLPLKSKQATIEWKSYQERRPTAEEITKWSGNGNENIAVICGKVSGNLVVLDFDSWDRYFSWVTVLQEKNLINEPLAYTKCSQTSKGVHVWLRTREPVKSQKFPQLDIKGEGGYIIVPPSIHPSGAEYKFLNDLPIKQINSLRDVGIDIDQKSDAPRNQPGWVSQLLQGASEGGRNDAAIKLTGYLRNSLPQDVTERILLDWNKRNSPPMPEGELLTTIASGYRLPEHNPSNSNGIRTNTNIRIGEGWGEGTCNVDSVPLQNVTKRYNLSGEIKDWIVDTGGAWFTTLDLDRDLNIKEDKDKLTRRVRLSELKKDGFLEKHNVISNKFRYIDAYAEKLDLLSASAQPLDIRLPFDLHTMVKMLPKTLIVCAGAADAGKSAFALNLCALNLGRMAIHYYSSEMGVDELASRVSLFEEPTLEAFNNEVDFRERCADFSDVIKPDDINIIDYLTMTEDFYKVNAHFIKIHEKLHKGIALVLIQKNRGAELGTGANKGLERPRLYITMDSGLLKIEKAKNWVNSSANPNKQQLRYKLVNGCKFIVTEDWYKDSYE